MQTFRLELSMFLKRLEQQGEYSAESTNLLAFVRLFKRGVDTLFG